MLEISQNIHFFINPNDNEKHLLYKDFRYVKKSNGYELYNKFQKIKLGVQLCDFLNIKFDDVKTIKDFINKYGIVSISGLTKLEIKNYYENDEYESLINQIIEEAKSKLKKYQDAFTEDIRYIFNLNNLEELENLSPVQRLYILRNSKKESNAVKMYNPKELKLELGNFDTFAKFSITDEEDAQEIANNVKNEEIAPYYFDTNNIIQSFIIELFAIVFTKGFDIRTCKNCGKYFVPDNRSDEIYCSNIYENGKTCKEVGHFRTQQKLMKENDDLRIYRNVYQKLLLRTRRNPKNEQYEKDFSKFKKENSKLKEKVNNGEITQEKYMEWLNKQ